ncbi:DUF4190 domain-containing protein [Kitasatospora sp. NPDC092948]|uniref:DUF4190 domain-containing protein n=1 Tax=Kitasatospora sp. NPDC092948 TaxID=3364088 RepID=UPI0037F4C834
MSGPVPGPFPGAVPPHVPPHIPSPNGTYWGQYPAPVPQPRNGLGVAALVLGIISLVLCLPLILFWFAWLPAVLAVVFGCIGLSLARKRQATNRPMALTGTVLGAVALLASIVTGGLLVADLASSNAGPSVTVGMHDDSEEQRLADEQAKEDAAKEADEKARHLSFGGSYTYSDGLKVTMAEPAATTPVKSPGSPLPQDATFVRLQVTVVNTSSAELSLYGSGLLIVKDSNDTLLYPLFGSGQYQGLPKSLAPGQEATAVETYGLPNASSDPFTLRFTHGTDLRDVTWIGSPPR